MVCQQCGKHSFRTFLHEQDGRNIWSCEDCYPLGKLNGWTTMEKIKSRSLAPDGKTVISGMAGVRLRSERLKAQALDSKRAKV